MARVQGTLLATLKEATFPAKNALISAATASRLISVGRGCQPYLKQQHRRQQEHRSGAGTDAVLPVKPVEPGPEDCCQSGCLECVWEVYRRDLLEYETAVAVQTGQAPPSSVDPFEELERQIAQKAAERAAAAATTTAEGQQPSQSGGPIH